METLFRLFLLKECHGWDHETALVEYLTQHPDFCDQLGLNRYRINPRCGAAGTIGSLLASKILLRHQRERSSSKRRMRALQSRVNQTDRTADMITRVRNRTPMTRPY